MYPTSLLEWIFTVAVVTVALCVACTAIVVCVPPLVREMATWFADNTDPPAASGLQSDRQHLSRVVRLGDRRAR